jgi:hypothetical protein
MAAARAMREVGEGQVRARGSAHEAPKAEGMPQRREGIMAPTSPAVRVRITLIRTSQVGFAGATYPRRGTDVKPGLPVGSTGNHLDGSATRGPDEEGSMPQKAWSAKRERQYKHIKEGLRKGGRSEETAEEIAARTVNKERARSGEAKTSSRASREDISSGRRGGIRSHQGAGGRTRDQLYEEAKDLNIEGRSRMNKEQLLRAVNRRTGRRSR